MLKPAFKTIALFLLILSASLIADHIHGFVTGKSTVVVDHIYNLLKLWGIWKAPIPEYVIVGTGVYICVFLPHGLFTIAVSRLLRVIGIYLVTIPNPNPECIVTRNRCHDLIISGHTTIFTATILCGKLPMKIVATIVFIFYILHAITELHHYSIDIYLGILVTTLAWKCSKQKFSLFNECIKILFK